MKKIIGRLMLSVQGWKFKTEVPLEEYKKSVLICAPHTSNWDFYYCLASFWALDVPFKFFIKDDYTKPWYGFIFRSMGAIGVNRNQRSNLVGYGIELLKKSDDLVLINTPEGSRSWVKEWKKGFYYMAKEAEVPVVLAFADYKNKIAGFKKSILVKDKTVEQVFDEIGDIYKPEMAKFPEEYNPKLYEKEIDK